MWSKYLINKYFLQGDKLIVSIDSGSIEGILYSTDDDSIVLLNGEDKSKILKSIIMLEDIQFISQEIKSKSVENLISDNGIDNIRLSDKDNMDEDDDQIDDFQIPLG